VFRFRSLYTRLELVLFRPFLRERRQARSCSVSTDLNTVTHTYKFIIFGRISTGFQNCELHLRLKGRLL